MNQEEHLLRRAGLMRVLEESFLLGTATVRFEFWWHPTSTCAASMLRSPSGVVLGGLLWAQLQTSSDDRGCSPFSLPSSESSPVHRHRDPPLNSSATRGGIWGWSYRVDARAWREFFAEQRVCLDCVFPRRWYPDDQLNLASLLAPEGMLPAVERVECWEEEQRLLFPRNVRFAGRELRDFHAGRRLLLLPPAVRASLLPLTNMEPYVAHLGRCLEEGITSEAPLPLCLELGAEPALDRCYLDSSPALAFRSSLVA